ncbi:hypothetical protein V8C42DRAFT_319829 [Trichoderma barbatum]
MYPDGATCCTDTGSCSVRTIYSLTCSGACYAVLTYRLTCSALAQPSPSRFETRPSIDRRDAEIRGKREKRKERAVHLSDCIPKHTPHHLSLSLSLFFFFFFLSPLTWSC